MKKICSLVIATGLGIGLAACTPGAPEEKDTFQYKGAAVQLSGQEYNKLPPLQQYQVTNRVMGALFTGLPAKEFFEKDTIGSDVSKLRVSANFANHIDQLKKQLQTPLENKEEIYKTVVGYTDSNNEPVPGKYSFDTTRNPLQFPAAFMYEMSRTSATGEASPTAVLSDEYFARWMAYKLMNTIMFSAAEEIDSSNEMDVQIIYENLVKSIRSGASIRSIILAHEKSQGNWRRFRSPEDNTREMIEIYLGLFDRDADVPKASKACQNWYLTDEDADYMLIQSANENTTPQLVLDNYYVTSCEEFFAAVANHPLVIPRVTTVLIDHMFGVDYDAGKRSALARDIANTNPETFKDVFMAILFSKEFLLNMVRPKWFEESFFNAGARTYWKPYTGFFNDLSRSTVSGSLNASLPAMYQPAFSLKLGRWPTVPLDVLATSYMHNGVRAALLVKQPDMPTANSTGWGVQFVEGLSAKPTNEFIAYMFISMLGRMPSDVEMNGLTQIIEKAKNGATDLKWNSAQNLNTRTMVVLDYLSRLPDLYYYNAVE